MAMCSDKCLEKGLQICCKDCEDVETCIESCRNFSKSYEDCKFKNGEVDDESENDNDIER